MALIWRDQPDESRQQRIDWVEVYVWALLGASVLLALGIGSVVGR